jgi:23S rRNA (cytosine1962-C5)-methyltransferase
LAKVILTRNRKKRIEQGHPWIYASEVESVDGEYSPGDIVDVINHQGHFLAKGYINPESQLRVRVMSYNSQEVVDEEWFIRRFQEAWSYRQRLLEDTNACRVVYGEADFLPGLIVDKYDHTLVIQILSLGMELRKDWIVSGLLRVFEPQCIYERSDVSIRELEGLELRTGTLYGDLKREVEIVENGLKFIVDIVEGQKTGYFFDQRENRAAIGLLMKGWGDKHGTRMRDVVATSDLKPVVDAKGRVTEVDLPMQRVTAEKKVVPPSDFEAPVYVKAPVDERGRLVKNPFWDGAEVLECFSHTGSFTLNACKHGAKKVTCLDISQHAIDTARRNVELNGYLHRVEFVVANAFDYLREQVKEGRQWDVVILDPPAFAKSKGAVQGACRGYKDINLHGMKLVREGGFLVTASCSFHMRPELFKETIAEAAGDAKKILRLVHWSGAGKDHPEIFGVDEGHYLKFAIFEVRSRS